jgi:hypothetical protein
MKALLAAMVISLTGCSAQMVQTRGIEKSQYAPVNEGKGGTIRYLAQGARSVLDQRRQSAYKQMHDKCGGAYRIVGEQIRSEAGSAMPIMGVMYYDQERWTYIDFECEPK